MQDPNLGNLTLVPRIKIPRIQKESRGFKENPESKIIGDLEKFWGYFKNLHLKNHTKNKILERVNKLEKSYVPPNYVTAVL